MRSQHVLANGPLLSDPNPEPDIQTIPKTTSLSATFPSAPAAPRNPEEETDAAPEEDARD